MKGIAMRMTWIIALVWTATASAQTIQERIDALHPHRGGEIRIASGTFTEPIVIQDRSYVRLVGTGRGTSGLNFKLTTPGPAIYIAGSKGTEIDNLTIFGTSNVEVGILACRLEYNGKQSSQLNLSRLNIQGEFLFAGVCTIGSELLEIRDCRIETRLPNTFGWWTGSKPPRYTAPGEHKKQKLHAPGPIAGGTNSVLLVDGRSYIVSTAPGVTSVHLGDGTINAEIRHLFISNSPVWHPTAPPVGAACVALEESRNVILDGIKCESPDARYGLHVKGHSYSLDVRGCRFGGRMALFVDEDGGLVNSEITRTNAFTTFGDRFKPVRVEGWIQGTVLDIGAYVD